MATSLEKARADLKLAEDRREEARHAANNLYTKTWELRCSGQQVPPGSWAAYAKAISLVEEEDQNYQLLLKQVRRLEASHDAALHGGRSTDPWKQISYGPEEGFADVYGECSEHDRCSFVVAIGPDGWPVYCPSPGDIEGFCSHHSEMLDELDLVDFPEPP